MKHSQLQFGKKGGDGTPSVLTCEERDEERTCEVEIEKDERLWEIRENRQSRGFSLRELMNK